jgi:hypothetical protein
VAGYEAAGLDGLGAALQARLAWDKLHYAMEDLLEHPARVPAMSMRALVRALAERVQG